MKAILKRLYSVDVDKSLDQFTPEIEDDFCFWARIIVSDENGFGEESFDVKICTPKWLLSNCKPEEVLFGRHYIIVSEYSYERIFSTIELYIKSIEGKSWDEIATKIGRIGAWEFEDYQSPQQGQ